MFFDSKLWTTKRYWQREGLQHALRNADAANWAVSHREFVAEVTSRLSIGMRVVELGCGGGHWFERLEFEARGCEYTGIDWNPESVAFGREKHSTAKFRCSNVAELTDLAEFDYVLACHSLFFLDQPTLERVLAQIRVGALITIREPTAYDIDSYALSRSKIRINKHRNKVVIYKHPYPAIVLKLGFEILSRQFTEFLSGKVKLVMTARRNVNPDARGLSGAAQRPS